MSSEKMELYSKTIEYVDESFKGKQKLDWMFDRISSEEHKNIVRDNYKKWTKELEKCK